jgi:hypothetical protein
VSSRESNEVSLWAALQRMALKTAYEKVWQALGCCRLSAVAGFRLARVTGLPTCTSIWAAPDTWAPTAHPEPWAAADEQYQARLARLAAAMRLVKAAAADALRNPPVKQGWSAKKAEALARVSPRTCAAVHDTLQVHCVLPDCCCTASCGWRMPRCRYIAVLPDGVLQCILQVAHATLQIHSGAAGWHASVHSAGSA